MPERVAFFVEGIPQPQGSKRALPNGVMIEAVKGLRPWRKVVAAHALAARQGEAMGACKVKLVFRFPRPKAAAKRRWMSVRPDIDKLARAVLDAITTAGVIQDDARVVWLACSKVYDDEGHYGVAVEVEALD
jgi:Holliday junction resolvase RusA-like endonuclease